MTDNLNMTPDIKISAKQTFGIDTDMEIEAFSKKMNLFQLWIKTTNLTKTPL